MSADDYEMDEGDGLPRELVGSWAKRKYALLRRYVDISGKACGRSGCNDPGQQERHSSICTQGPGAFVSETHPKFWTEGLS